MTNRCISCGEIIPEGRQVCPSCTQKHGSRKRDVRAEYVILFRRGRKGKERLVIMPTEKKLLQWIEKNAGACSQVRIIKSEGSEV